MLYEESSSLNDCLCDPGDRYEGVPRATRYRLGGPHRWAPRFIVNSGGCIVCPFALARKYLFLRDEHLVSIDGVLGVLKRAQDDASLFASLVCTDADRIRTTGGSPLLETVEPERYVMA